MHIRYSDEEWSLCCDFARGDGENDRHGGLPLLVVEKCHLLGSRTPLV